MWTKQAELQGAVLDFWWCLSWVSKPGCITQLRASSPQVLCAMDSSDSPLEWHTCWPLQALVGLDPGTVCALTAWATMARLERQCYVRCKKKCFLFILEYFVMYLLGDILISFVFFYFLMKCFVHNSPNMFQGKCLFIVINSYLF